MLKFCIEGVNMSKIIMLFAVGGVLLSVCVQCNGAGKAQLSEAEIDAKLSALKPLPKVHYSFACLGCGMINDRNSRRLYECARITHALTSWGQGLTQEQLDNCVYACARVNKTNPKIPASVAVCFKPWHRKFGKDLPPTDRGPTYYEEIRYFSQCLKRLKKWLAEANQKYGSKVKLGAILLDCERFSTKKYNRAWNEGIREALDAIHIQAKKIFLEARIEWYDRGVKRYRGVSWAKTGRFTGKEIKAPLSCPLYALPETERMRETYRRTCALADSFNIEEVTPWVALAAGYRPSITEDEYWDMDWDYDLVYSYKFGAELNVKAYGDQPKKYAPYNRAKVIIFYPPPFDRRTPQWAKHFIAYVRGATGVRELEDLGYEE